MDNTKKLKIVFVSKKKSNKEIIKIKVFQEWLKFCRLH